MSNVHHFTGQRVFFGRRKSPQSATSEISTTGIVPSIILIDHDLARHAAAAYSITNSARISALNQHTDKFIHSYRECARNSGSGNVIIRSCNSEHG